jgi:hypothetical protein
MFSADDIEKLQEGLTVVKVQSHDDTIKILEEVSSTLNVRLRLYDHNPYREQDNEFPCDMFVRPKDFRDYGFVKLGSFGSTCKRITIKSKSQKALEAVRRLSDIPRS